MTADGVLIAGAGNRGGDGSLGARPARHQSHAVRPGRRTGGSRRRYSALAQCHRDSRCAGARRAPEAVDCPALRHPARQRQTGRNGLQRSSPDRSRRIVVAPAGAAWRQHGATLCEPHRLPSDRVSDPTLAARPRACCQSVDRPRRAFGTLRGPGRHRREHRRSRRRPTAERGMEHRRRARRVD